MKKTAEYARAHRELKKGTVEATSVAGCGKAHQVEVECLPPEHAFIVVRWNSHCGSLVCRTAFLTLDIDNER